MVCRTVFHVLTLGAEGFADLKKKLNPYLNSQKSSTPNRVVFSSTLPKCWSFSFSISPSNEYSGLISFRIDWLDLLAVQGTLKSLLQHHS